MKYLIAYLFTFLSCFAGNRLHLVNASAQNLYFNINEGPSLFHVPPNSTATYQFAPPTTDFQINAYSSEGFIVYNTEDNVYHRGATYYVRYSEYPDLLGTTNGFWVESEWPGDDWSRQLTYFLAGFVMMATFESIAMMRRMAGKIASQTGGEV